ncbi:MAG: ATP-grasp domain-containing protein [Promethearchaeota archaeon]
MNIWLLSNDTLGSELREFESRAIAINYLSWKDISIPLASKPTIVRWMMDPNDMVFQLGLMEEFQRSGIRIINAPEFVIRCDKASIYFIWNHYLKGKITMPATIITSRLDDALNFAKKHERILMKPLSGQGGKGIQLLSRDDEDLEEKMRELMQKGKKRLFQEFIGNCQHEIRTILIGNEEPIQYIRYSDGFLNNISMGGKIARIDDERFDTNAGVLAKVKRVSKIIQLITGLDLIAVDTLIDDTGSPWLLEWNPFFQHSKTEAIGLNIARSIVKFILGIH